MECGSRRTRGVPVVALSWAVHGASGFSSFGAPEGAVLGAVARIPRVSSTRPSGAAKRGWQSGNCPKSSGDAVAEPCPGFGHRDEEDASTLTFISAAPGFLGLLSQNSGIVSFFLFLVFIFYFLCNIYSEFIIGIRRSLAVICC